MYFLDLKSNKERMILDLKAMGFRNVVLLGHYSYKEAKKKLEMHKHKDMIEICFLETGSQLYQVGSNNYFLKGGDILITPPNIVHGTSKSPEEKGSLFWMILKVPKSAAFRILNLTPKESRILINRLLHLNNLHFRGSSTMKKTLIKIFSSYNERHDPLKKIEIANHILNFLLSVIDCGEKINNKVISADIVFCCTYIKENIFQKIYITKLAEIINLSESRFKHKFKEETGMPPNEYIIKQKIEKAKELMPEAGTTVTNLAYDLGFSSSSYFSTVFKKHLGISPTEYKSLVCDPNNGNKENTFLPFP